MNLPKELLFIGPMVFLAGFIDSIAGGGGLISLPAYSISFFNEPIITLLGTNKFSSVWGALTSSYQYIRNKKFNMPVAVTSIIFSLVGSFAGAQFALIVDNTIMRYVIVGVTPIISVFILTKKDFGNEKEKKLKTSKIILLASIICFFIGMYDGFFGPGTGTFLAIAFTSILGFDIVTATGNAKIANLASNIAAVVAFASKGKIMYNIAIPAALCSMAGNYLGAKLAMKNGKKITKKIFVLVLILLLGTCLYQITNL